MISAVERTPAQPRRATLAAALCSTIGFLPVFLLAAQGVLVRAELQFNEAQLGVAVSVFFAAGALMSAPGGRVSERLGPRTGMLASGAAVGVLLVALAAGARSWSGLLLLLGLAGGVNAISQTSGDLSVARGVPQRLQGFAYGVKTSCVPLATLFAGVAIPAIGVRLGWRASFVAATGLVVVLSVLAPRRSSFTVGHRRRQSLSPDATRATMLLLTVAGALSIGAVNTMGAFYTESALRQDLSPSAAGWWLAAGSAAAVAARVLIGRTGDRISGGHLRLCAVLWLAGAVGIVLLAPVGSLMVFAVGTAVGFIAGSGWTGLYLNAVVRANPSAPAAASGVVMTGQLGGSVVGPLAFGAVVSNGSYAAAWIGTAGALLLAAAMMPLAERMLARTDRPVPEARSSTP